MRDGRWKPLGVAVLVLMLCLAHTPHVAAQPSLPPDVFTASPLTSAQQQQVQDFVAQWGGVLRGGGELTQIVDARGRLQQPLLIQTSDDFREAYSNAIARELEPALADESLVIRLNAMIVASRLSFTPAVVDLIAQAMQDESPAVRYWAVKAVSTNPAGGRPNPQAVQRFLQTLDRLLQTEQSTEVLEQTYKAMIQLEGPNTGALERVINSLNRRVTLHVNDPHLSYRPEAEAMREAFARLVDENVRRGGMTELFRQLARAAGQHAAVVSRNAMNHQLTPQRAAEYHRMAEIAFHVLEETRKQFNSAVAVPSAPQVRSDLGNRNWNALLLHAQQFREMLTNPPFNFDPVDVTPAVD
jgi:hypothetical protein